MEYDFTITDVGTVGLWQSNLNEVCVLVEDPYAAFSPSKARQLAAALTEMANAIEAECVALAVKH